MIGLGHNKVAKKGGGGGEDSKTPRMMEENKRNNEILHRVEKRGASKGLVANGGKPAAEEAVVSGSHKSV